MNDNLAITPSLTMIDGEYYEAYKRETRATTEELERLGIDPSNRPAAKMGAPMVNEYIRLIGANIAKDSRHVWKIADLGTDVEIDNIYVQVPTQDYFDLELYDANNVKLLDLSIGRSRNGLELPNSILTQDLTLKVYARADIGLIVVNCRPAVLLATHYGTSETAAN